MSIFYDKRIINEGVAVGLPKSIINSISAFVKGIDNITRDKRIANFDDNMRDLEESKKLLADYKPKKT